MSDQWPCLTSDPEQFTQFVALLEKQGKVRFKAPYTKVVCEDVYSLDPGDFCPTSPPSAFILLVELSKKMLERYKNMEASPSETCGTSKFLVDQEAREKLNIIFTKQNVRNACGPVAIVNCLINLRDKLTYDGLDDVKLDPDVCAKKFEEQSELRTATETLGDQEHLESDANIQTHFIALVNAGNHVVELDGRLKAPIDHGEIQKDFHTSAFKVIRSIIENDKTNMNFSVLSMMVMQ